MINNIIVYIGIVLITFTLHDSMAGDLASAESMKWPAVTGAAFALRNNHFSSPRIAFDVNGHELLDFECAPHGRAFIGRFHDLVCDGGSFIAKDAGQWVGINVQKSQAFTIELTVTPAVAVTKTQEIVFCYCDEKGEDIALLQNESQLFIRQKNDLIGICSVGAGKPIHVLITCEKEKLAAYRDGERLPSNSLKSSFTDWSPREIVLGSEFSGKNCWRGRVEGIAVFPKAFNAEEVAREAVASRAFINSRKSTTTLRFKGTLIRQAKTSDLNEIRPYTRSLTAAEYKVDKVIAGDWKSPTITVLHWMILDAKRLKIADRKPGCDVELVVERLDDHLELESCRRDEIEGDTNTEIFYCEREE